MSIEIRPGWSYDRDLGELNIHGVRVNAKMIEQWLDRLEHEFSGWHRFRRDGDVVTVEVRREEEKEPAIVSARESLVNLGVLPPRPLTQEHAVAAFAEDVEQWEL